MFHGARVLSRTPQAVRAETPEFSVFQNFSPSSTRTARAQVTDSRQEALRTESHSHKRRNSCFCCANSDCFCLLYVFQTPIKYLIAAFHPGHFAIVDIHCSCCETKGISYAWQAKVGEAAVFICGAVIFPHSVPGHAIASCVFMSLSRKPPTRL